MSYEYQQIKLVIVGDGSTGKTCVMLRHTEKYFNTDYVPTIFDNKTQVLKVDNIPVNLSLWDTAGQEEYSKLRSVAYPHSDIFLIAFSVVDSTSFLNAKKKWLPQVKNEVPNAIILFIGLKCDLRESNSKTSSKAQLQRFIMGEFNCGYMQCSALLDIGVNEIFDEAVRLVLIDRGLIKNKRSNTQKSIKEEEVRSQGRCYCCIM